MTADDEVMSNEADDDKDGENEVDDIDGITDKVVDDADSKGITVEVVSDDDVEGITGEAVDDADSEGITSELVSDDDVERITGEVIDDADSERITSELVSDDDVEGITGDKDKEVGDIIEEIDGDKGNGVIIDGVKNELVSFGRSKLVVSGSISLSIVVVLQFSE